MEKKTTSLEAANLLMFCEMGSVWWDGSGLCIPVGLDLFSRAPRSASLLWLGDILSRFCISIILSSFSQLRKI